MVFVERCCVKLRKWVWGWGVGGLGLISWDDVID